jgi:hypothetical protein
MRKFTFNANQTIAQQQLIAAANLNPRKPYFRVTYRDDLLRFANPTIQSLASKDEIPFTYQATSALDALVAGYDSSGMLRAGSAAMTSPSVAGLTALIDSGARASITGTWSNISGSWLYYYAQYSPVANATAPTLHTVNSSGAKSALNQSGLPGCFYIAVNGSLKGSGRSPSAFVVMDSGDKIVVIASYLYITNYEQYVCTLEFYHAGPGSTEYRKLRTVIQFDIGKSITWDPSVSTIPDAGRVFGISKSAGDFFIVANDGTKAVRFTYKNGVEGMVEPIIPIDIDANRLEIKDSLGNKTYGKYSQFMPCGLTEINGTYYLNGQMTRTYSNGDAHQMEVYLASKNGVNWSVGDVSFFIDSKYYKYGEQQRKFNYQLVYHPGSSTVHAMGNNCYTSAAARDIDKGTSGTDFSEIVIEGQVSSQTNSVDSMGLLVMQGFSSINPEVLGGKTISLDLGYYDSAGAVKNVKMGEYFVDSEMHVLTNQGRGPNKVNSADAGAWKLTRWSSITDIDRWSSTYIKDDLKKLSKIIVKGISSDYKAVDNTTGSGLYLSNLNDPFIGYTSTRDERDGMFTVCARFTDTGANGGKHRLSSIGLLIGAEDYTDIYTKGAADRKGFNAYMIPSQSEWTGHIKTAPQMRKSNLRRRFDDPATPQDETDVQRAFQWTRRYTNLWERQVYTTGTDDDYSKITSACDTFNDNVISSAAFAAEHGVDYEFVVRRHSGRVQLYQRKKGFGQSTIAASAYNEYTLIHEYQFSKNDRIDWGARPYWGFVANTDVFASLEGWNSREYGNIETSFSEAYNFVNGFQDFPDSKLASFGTTVYVPNTTYQAQSVINQEITQFVEGTPSSGGGYWETVITPVQGYVNISTGSGADYYLIQKCAPMSIQVGEIVRCFVFAELSPALDFDNCTANINRGANSNVLSQQEFYGVIKSIENEGTAGWKRIRFSKTWGGFIPPYSGTPWSYAIYKVGEADTYGKASSGSLFSNVLVNIDGTTLPLDIKNGTVKQAQVTAGRAAIVNRQNDAISIRLIESDGSTHILHEGSPETRLAYDYPTNPISSPDFVGSSGFYNSNGTAIVTTREWRILMQQGRLFPFSSTTFGLPDGQNKSYMIKGDEIVRYINWGYKKRGSDVVNGTWCIIPAYYTPIFPSVKGEASVQQWSVSSIKQLNGEPTTVWTEPGDKFNSIANISGMRVYINGKGGYYSVEGDTKYYAVSSVANNGGDTASRLNFSPALKSGADFMDPAAERTKDVDKQLKEIAIVSGREQLGTASALQSYKDPLCFYPIGSSATQKPDSFVKVNYWSMNAGLYNSAKENLKYVCNLAGIFDVKFMDESGNLSTGATSTISQYDVPSFALEMSCAVTSSSVIHATFRSAYKLTINVDEDASSRGVLTLTLQTIPGFTQASNIFGNSLLNQFCTIAKVSVPVSDIALDGDHSFNIVARKERVSVEMDHMPVWSFDLSTYKFGGAKNDAYDLYTEASGPIVLGCSSVNGGIDWTLVELSEEVENQILDMSMGGGDAVQFITRERHIHARSTQDGGIQFGKFLMDSNREYPATGAALPTANYIKDELEYNPFQVPGHVLVTGAEYGEHIDPVWIRQNGYMFNTNQNRLLDTVSDSIREAKLLMRMTKEDSDNSQMEMIGVPHIQPEDGVFKTYGYENPSSPESWAANESSIVSGHAIQFNQSTMKSMFKIRKKYSLE